jgi:1,4-dihydroxy-2-naphthoate octaprenyltransferase
MDRNLRNLWMQGTRPRTLPASVAPVFVGAASAWRALQQSTICPLIYPTPQSCVIALERYRAAEVRFPIVFGACILLALFLQIAVNLANDYSDGIRGTDDSRVIQESDFGKPQRLVASGVNPKSVLRAAAITAGIACLFGVLAVWVSGQYLLLPVGVLCVLAGWFYTGGRHPYGYLGFGEVFVFVFFGGVATLGTQYALAGSIDAAGAIGAVCTGLLSCVMLMVNNLRDISDDAKSGKRTLAVRLGTGCAVALLYATMLIPALMMIFAVYLGVAGGLQRLWPVALLAIWCLGSMWSVVGAIRQSDFKRALSRSGISVLLYALTHIVVMLMA